MEERAIPLKSNNLWGWADIYNAKEIVEPKYDSVFYYYKKGFIVIKNKKSGVIECDNYNQCNQILEPLYDDINYYPRHGYVTTINDKKGFINKEKSILIDNLYDKIILVDEFIYVINNEKFKSGVYSMEDKKQIISSNYEIISIEYEHFWKDRTEDKEKAFIKFDIFSG
ncbi:hypothetical protein [Moheibacter sediminis]|uniref:WG containing repeat-containing protein n=1 Tax=Moheibacter sediminis TaxID=1434700 RepID=A0A1W1ZE82_9FLAO|nr:hypothetical protein [Moheibacter sediminis]SMC46769.1 hypothetical protein SAMN06296427_102432 [Moheibacter sediminis]